VSAIRPFHVNVPEAKLAELRRRINALCLRPATPHGSLAIITRAAVIGIAVALHALSASAQTARDIKGPTALVTIQNDAPAKLIVDPPIPEQLALGRVFISSLPPHRFSEPLTFQVH
jgi:hypothetical protein